MSSKITFSDIILALEPTGFFTPDATVPLVALAATIIVGLVSLFFYAFVKNIRPRLERAKGLEKLLDQLESDHPQRIESVHVWDGEVNQEIERLPFLHERWVEFREHCLTESHQLSSFEEPADYFQELAPPPEGFSANVSGLLTAIGILGTFLGIIIGLGQVGAGMNGASSEEMQAVMGQLIQSLGVSFRTSIWGLILSMVTTALMSRAEARLDSQRIRWVGWLDQAVPRSRMHDFALRQINLMSEQHDTTQQLLKQQERFQNLWVDTFKAAVHGSPQKPGLLDAINNIGKQIAETQNEGLEQLVDQFMTMMQQRMGDDFGALGDTLREIVTANQQFQGTMQGLIDQLKSASAGQGQSTAHMQEALAGAARAIAEMQGSLSGLSGVTGSIQEAANAMSSILSQQTKAASAQNGAMDTLVNGLETQSSEIMAAYKDLHTQFGDLSGAISGLVDWHSRIRDSLSQQVTLFMQATEAQRVVSAELANSQKTALKISAQLANSSSAIGPASKELANAGSTIRQASEGLFTTETALRSLTTSLEDASQELSDRQLHAINQFTEINNLLKQVLSRRS